MSRSRTKILLLFLTVFVAACSRKHLPFNTMEHFPGKSVIFAELELPKKQLLKHVERRIDELAATPLRDGNLRVEVRRAAPVSMTVDDESIYYDLTIDLNVTLGAFAKAEGRLLLQFRSAYGIHEDWTLTTHTQMAHYQWVRKPSGKILGLRIPVEKPANIIVNRLAPPIAQSIDEQIAKASNFRPAALQALRMLEQPIEVDSEYGIFLKIKPARFAIAKPVDEEDRITGGIKVEAILKAGFDSLPEGEILLPPLQVTQQVAHHSVVVVNVELPVDSINSLLRKQIIGETFEWGNKRIKVDDLTMDIAGRLWMARIKTSGAVNGFFDVSGVPYMNRQHDRILVGDFDLRLTGGRFWQRTALRLFKHKLRREVEAFINRRIMESIGKIEEDIKKNYHIEEDFSNFDMQFLPKNKITYNFTADDRVLRAVLFLNGTLKIKLEPNGQF